MQKNIGDLATELSRDEKVRRVMDESEISAQYIYDLIYVKQYIATWESIRRTFKKLYGVTPSTYRDA